MTLIITLFGLFILLAGIVLLIKPNLVFDFIGNKRNKTFIFVLAILVRLLLGALLIAVASQSKFPVVIQLLGWLFVVVAVALVIIGKRRFGRLIGWVLSRFAPYARASGLIAIFFGGFLIYAFL